MTYMSTGTVLYWTHTVSFVIQDLTWWAALVEVPGELSVKGKWAHALVDSPATVVPMNVSSWAHTAVCFPVVDFAKWAVTEPCYFIVCVPTWARWRGCGWRGRGWRGLGRGSHGSWRSSTCAPAGVILVD